MRTTTFVVLFCLFLAPGVARAQEEEVADKKFWAVSTFLIGSTIYDIESTYFVLGKCKTCEEGNPIMRPFVKAGKPALYAAQGSIDAGVLYMSYKMKKGDTRFKKVWWLLPVAMAAGHMVAGTYNMRFAIRF